MVQIPTHLTRHSRSPVPQRVPEDLLINGFPIHADLASFYRVSGGISLTGIGTDVLGIVPAAKYAKDLEYHPLSEAVGLWPITDSNDSDPYCVCLNPRFNGAILHLSHDGETRFTHNSLSAFLIALEALVVAKAELIDDCQADFPLDVKLMQSADEVLAEFLGGVDADEAVLAPLLSACSPAAIVQGLSSENMWVREEAAVLLGMHKYVPARAALAALSEAGDRQDNRAARASLSIVNKAAFFS